MTDETHGDPTGVVEPLSAEDAPTEADANRIIFTFKDDHNIGGMKVEIKGVTPEQCAVAAYHLLRSANQLSDAIMMRRAQERGEVDAIMRELRNGGKGGRN